MSEVNNNVGVGAGGAGAPGAGLNRNSPFEVVRDMPEEFYNEDRNAYADNPRRLDRRQVAYNHVPFTVRLIEPGTAAALPKVEQHVVLKPTLHYADKTPVQCELGVVAFSCTTCCCLNADGTQVLHALPYRHTAIQPPWRFLKNNFKKL